MATIDNKKAQKKKVKKGKAKVLSPSEDRTTSKLSNSEVPVGVNPETISSAQLGSNLSSSEAEFTENDHLPALSLRYDHNRKLVVEEIYSTPTSSPEPDPLTNNPYLNREKCLLCQRNREPDDESDSEDEELKIGPHNYALSQMSLWVCSKCKTTLEEEERKGDVDSTFFTDADPIKFLSDIPITTNGLEEMEQKACDCEACKDRRQIENEQDEENNLLQLCWAELLHAIKCIYRENKKCLKKNGGSVDCEKCKQHVARLCARDAHQLFQRLESHSIDYILEVKVRILQQLTTGHSTPEQAKAVVGMMLEEYTSLCASAKILSDIFKQLEIEHLKKFVFNWELHDKHLFRNIVYADSALVSAMPMLITQLRLGAATKEAYVENSYPSILHKYLKFDDDMSVVTAVWRDCQMRLDQYTDEQAAIQAKQRMLREDWEFFSAQRKMLKDQIMKNHEKAAANQSVKASNVDSPIPSPPPLRTALDSLSPASVANLNAKCADSQFSDAMRTLLEGSAARKEPFTCPNCNKQRCPCHECSISHLITCGILAPELQDTLLPMGTDGSCGASTNPFTITPSSLGYDISVKAPSFSSTDTSSEGDSDGPYSGYASTDSWDEKLKLNPNINLFEEFLKEAANEPKLKRKGGSVDLDKIAPNNLSEPSPCQCHECKKPVCLNSNVTGISQPSSISTNTTTTTTGHSAAFSSTVPVSNIPKPAALHLYPHIHGSRAGHIDPAYLGAARLASGGSLSAAHSLIQPQLYNLHNTLAHQSPLLRHLEKLKQKKGSSAFNTPCSESFAPQPCVKDQLNSIHTCPATDQSSSQSTTQPTSAYPIPGIDTAPYFSTLNACANYSNYKFPDVSSYTSTTRVNQSDLLSAPPLPSFDHNAFSLDPMLANGLPLLNNATSKASVLHSWQLMKQQVLPSCLKAYPHAADSDGLHEHTDECFKHLRGPLNNTTKTFSHTNTEPADRFAPVCTATVTTTTSAPAPRSDNSNVDQIRVPSDTTIYPVTNCGSNSIQQQPVTTLSTTKTKHSTVPTCQHNSSHKTKPTTSTTTKSHDSAKSNVKTERRPTTGHHHSSAASQQCGETEGGGCSANSDEEDGDSCSGQSSSTSTSNQKDSKYCDCCYCEFFGHGQPAPAPTSKNFAEIRERLRLRLKKKKQNPCAKGHDLVPISALEAVTAATTPSVKSAAILAASQGQLTCMDHKPLDSKVTSGQAMETKGHLGVEELLKFITGEEVEKTEPPKLDKKQRKKLKKAEQKARRLEQAKQLERSGSKSSVADSDSDVDSDSDKIISQLQEMSSRHQKANNKRDKTTSKQTVHPPQSKKNQNNKAEDRRQSKSSSPDNDKNKPAPHQAPQSRTHSSSSSRSSKSGNTNNSNRDVLLTPSKRHDSPSSNAKSSQPLSDRANQSRTHDDLRAHSSDNGGTKSQHSSRPTTTRTVERKHVGAPDKKKGDKKGSEQLNNVTTTTTTTATTADADDGKSNVNNKMVCKKPLKSQNVLPKRRQQPEGQEALVPTAKPSPPVSNGKVGNSASRSSASPRGQQTEKKTGDKKYKLEDDVFLPMDDEEVEESDQFAKELNDFKRFVATKPPEVSRISVNLNMKDVQVVKRKGVAC